MIAAVSKDTEIIVVDDASTDGSVMFLRQNFPAVKVVQHEANLRFGVACNTGVKAAKGDIVILLNTDVVPQKGFITSLQSHFQNINVFSVGCKEIEDTGGKRKISGRTEGRFERGFLVHWRPKDQESQDTLWTFGGSMAVDRKKYLQLNGFDPMFAPAYWEDIDLCWRAREKGWHILFEKDAVVHHNHETTNKTVFGQRKMEVMSYRNQILFVWKHYRGKQLIAHFLWLPYHLIFTAIRTKGTFFLGLLQAIYRIVTYKYE